MKNQTKTRGTIKKGTRPSTKQDAPWPCTGFIT